MPCGTSPRTRRRWPRSATTRPASPTAVEEFLRYITPLAHIGRTVATDTEIDGHRFAAGDLVSLCFAAANRDPRVFDAPERCIVNRKPNRHVAFGHGPHTCIGAPLARMELTVVIERFLLTVTGCTVVCPDTWDARDLDTVTTGSSFPHDLRLRIA